VIPSAAPSWRIRDALVAVLAGLLAAGFTQLPFGADPSPAALFGVIVPAQTAATVAVVALLAERRGGLGTLGWGIERADARGLIIGVGLQVALGLTVTLIALLFTDDVPEQEVVELASEAIGPGDRVLVVLGAVILAPLSEEIVFRGVLLRALLARTSRRAAIVWSSVAFAALHLLDPNAIVAVPALFVVGIVLARQVADTGRLPLAILTHVGFNGFSILVLFLAESA
jgi:membrane protease YdiL (CAAX protease family)